jgi:hypothetical protein
MSNGTHTTAIAVDGLAKSFDEVEAVRGVSFEVATRGLPRPERRRQVDDDQHAQHAREADGRKRDCGRLRPPRRVARRTPPPGLVQ